MSLLKNLECLSRLPIARCDYCDLLSINDIASKHGVSVSFVASVCMSELSVFSKIRVGEEVRISREDLKLQYILVQGNMRKLQDV